MNTCESCMSREQVTDCDVACSKGITQNGRLKITDFGCTLWEAKPIEFEGEVVGWGRVGVEEPDHITFRASGVCDIPGGKYKVTLEPTK